MARLRPRASMSEMVDFHHCRYCCYHRYCAGCFFVSTCYTPWLPVTLIAAIIMARLFIIKWLTFTVVIFATPFAVQDVIDQEQHPEGFILQGQVSAVKQEQPPPPEASREGDQKTAVIAASKKRS